jgi:glycosyltransferase involved in cell wall biosynthesis
VSYREVASLSSLEAAAAGCEIVVGEWGSAEEYFGDRAHRCDVASPTSVATAIVGATTLPSQPGLRALVEATFDWSVPGRALADVYRRLDTRR